MRSTKRDRFLSSLTTVQALFLVLAVPTLICTAYALLAFVFEWFAVCLSDQIFAFCMKSWTFPFSPQRMQSFQNNLQTILGLFAITTTVAIVQCCAIAVPLAYFLSQGVSKDAHRSWRFFATSGGLVAVLPWAVLTIDNWNSFGPVLALFLLFIIGAVVGLTMKRLLLRMATRETQKIAKSKSRQFEFEIL